MSDQDYWLNASWELLEQEMGEWLDDLFHFRYPQAAQHWRVVKLYIATLGGLIIDRIVSAADSAASSVEDWVEDRVGVIEEGATTVVKHIENIWGSITSVWATFGPDLLDSGLTVQQWIRGKLDFMYDWITEGYDDAKIWVMGWGGDVIAAADAAATWIEQKTEPLITWMEERADSAVEWLEEKVEPIVAWFETKAEAAWAWTKEQADKVATWINERSEAVSTWFDEAADAIKEWYDRNADYYSGIYDNYRELLSSFLEDPLRFITDYVSAWLGGTEEEPSPTWYTSLLAFLADPIGWLLTEFGEFHAKVEVWLTDWLEENFEPIEEALAQIEPPHLTMPNVEDWLKGLREPETAEEKGYVEWLDTKLAQILDGTILDHPPERLG